MGNANRYSPAVMASRIEPPDSLDFFPTPPWGTRALCKYVLSSWPLSIQTVWEPAAGRGHMVRPLSEFFATVFASDVHDYGCGYRVGSFVGEGQDVIDCPFQPDWIITNPPFRLGEEFVNRALNEARVGVAMLARTAFIESSARYQLFAVSGFHCLAPFSARLPMVKGRCDPNASSATSYSWFVWLKKFSVAKIIIIPPNARSKLERDSDYSVEEAA